MKIYRKSLIVTIGVVTKDGESTGNHFAMMHGYFYGSYSKYKLKEFYTKYIKALYED